MRIKLRRNDILHHDDEAEPSDQRLLTKQQEMRDPHCDQHSKPDRSKLNCDRQGLVVRIDGDVPRRFSRAGDTGAWWKRRVHHISVAAEPDTHRITQLLTLAKALGLEPATDIVCPRRRAGAPSISRRAPYAVLHANPFYRYKRWTDAGWRALARALAERGLTVAVTGAGHGAERAYLDALWATADPAVERLDGRLNWPELASLLSGAAVYVGPDTSTTHLAAACGCPTVALYGPTSPRLIGPWPVGGLARPWNHAGTIQRRGNVWVVQNPLPCLPCEKLGCEGHLDSRSQCLDELSVAQVLTAVDQALSHDRLKSELAPHAGASSPS